MKAQATGWLGKKVRDQRTGITGIVVGVTTWLDNPSDSLIIQPPTRFDGTVPPTVSAWPAAVEEVPIAMVPYQ